MSADEHHALRLEMAANELERRADALDELLGHIGGPEDAVSSTSAWLRKQASLYRTHAMLVTANAEMLGNLEAYVAQYQSMLVSHGAPSFGQWLMRRETQSLPGD